MRVILFFVACFIHHVDSTYLYSSHRDLFNYLFVENYTSAIRSKCEHKPLNVSIDVALREIVGVSEKSESVKLKIWVRLQWNDCKFIWNPLDFGNTSTMVVPYDTIWIPDITLFEGIDGIANMPDKKEYNAAIKYNGLVMYQFPTTIQSTCGMDVSWFPYDQQKCTLSFGSWIYTLDDVDVYPLRNHGDLSILVRHQEWIVVSLSAKRETSVYQDEFGFSRVTFRLTIERKPTFYLLTMILPFFIITVLSLAGFVLPSASGEKITFHMTILLSVTVFLLLIQEKMPASSESFPKIGVYFTVTLVMTCLSCLLSAIVLYLFYKDLSGKIMPHWVQIVFLKRLGKLFCVKDRRLIQVKDGGDQYKEEMKASPDTRVRTSDIRTDKANKSRKNIKSNDFEGIENAIYENSPENGNEDLCEKQEGLNDSPVTTKKSESSTKTMNDWELLAFTLDRFFTILYIVLTMINNFSFLIIMSQNNQSND